MEELLGKPHEAAAEPDTLPKRHMFMCEFVLVIELTWLLQFWRSLPPKHALRKKKARAVHHAVLSGVLRQCADVLAARAKSKRFGKFAALSEALEAEVRAVLADDLDKLSLARLEERVEALIETLLETSLSLASLLAIAANVMYVQWLWMERAVEKKPFSTVVPLAHRYYGGADLPALLIATPEPIVRRLQSLSDDGPVWQRAPDFGGSVQQGMGDVRLLRATDDQLDFPLPALITLLSSPSVWGLCRGTVTGGAVLRRVGPLALCRIDISERHFTHVLATVVAAAADRAALVCVRVPEYPGDGFGFVANGGSLRPLIRKDEAARHRCDPVDVDVFVVDARASVDPPNRCAVAAIARSGAAREHARALLSAACGLAGAVERFEESRARVLFGDFALPTLLQPLDRGPFLAEKHAAQLNVLTYRATHTVVLLAVEPEYKLSFAANVHTQRIGLVYLGNFELLRGDAHDDEDEERDDDPDPDDRGSSKSRGGSGRRGAALRSRRSPRTLEEYKPLFDALVANDLTVLLVLVRSVQARDRDSVSAAAATAIKLQPKRVRAYLRHLVVAEARTSDEGGTTLFRGVDAGIQIVSAYMRSLTEAFVRRHVAELIRRVTRANARACVFEWDANMVVAAGVDPAKRSEVQARNLGRLLAAVGRFFDDMIADAGAFDPRAGALLHMIHTVCAREVFHGDTSHYNAVNNFVFLRNIVPGIVAPDRLGIPAAAADLDNMHVRRALLIVSKLVQNVVNGVQIAARDSLQMPLEAAAELSAFIDRYALLVRAFFDTLMGAHDQAGARRQGGVDRDDALAALRTLHSAAQHAAPTIAYNIARSTLAQPLRRPFFDMLQFVCARPAAAGTAVELQSSPEVMTLMRGYAVSRRTGLAIKGASHGDPKAARGIINRRGTGSERGPASALKASALFGDAAAHDGAPVVVGTAEAPPLPPKHDAAAGGRSWGDEDDASSGGSGAAGRAAGAGVPTLGKPADATAGFFPDDDARSDDSGMSDEFRARMDSLIGRVAASRGQAAAMPRDFFSGQHNRLVAVEDAKSELREIIRELGASDATMDEVERLLEIIGTPAQRPMSRRSSFDVTATPRQ